jgi:hypothetical protein
LGRVRSKHVQDVRMGMDRKMDTSFAQLITICALSSSDICLNSLTATRVPCQSALSSSTHNATRRRESEKGREQLPTHPRAHARLSDVCSSLTCAHQQILHHQLSPEISSLPKEWLAKRSRSWVARIPCDPAWGCHQASPPTERSPALTLQEEEQQQQQQHHHCCFQTGARFDSKRTT